MKKPKIVQNAVHFIRRQKDQHPPVQQLRRWFFLRNIPPLGNKNSRTIELERELRKQISLLPSDTTASASTAINKWMGFKNEIRRHALTDDARTFMSWPPVRDTMHSIPHLSELQFLKTTSRWETTRQALEHRGPTQAFPFYALPSANENSIRQAYHLFKFLTETHIKIDEIEQIVEFGGGYGSMCLLLFRLGFKGKYYIFDWPELSALQNYYLRSEGRTESVSFLHSPEMIDQLLDKHKKTLLIGTWSLSECSVELRNSIIEKVDPDLFLIAYQKKFGEVDNQAYFKNLQTTRPDITWKEIPIEHIPSAENIYLFGTS